VFRRLLFLPLLAIDSRVVLGRRVFVVLVDSMIGLQRLRAHWITRTTRMIVVVMLNGRPRLHGDLSSKETRWVLRTLFIELIVCSW
jgi:hypothetical protein